VIDTIESFLYKGIWWSIDDPDNKVSGTLAYIPNKKASLDLGGFIKNPKIIHGISSSGKKITLYEFSSVTSHHNYPGFETSEYRPRIIFVGEHLSEELAFTSVSINYSYLQDWLDTNGFIEGRHPEISITYKKPERLMAKLNNKYNISVDYGLSVNREFGKYVNIRQTAYIITESSEDEPFDEYVEIMNHTMNFLTLAICEPVYPLIINARTKSMNPSSDSIMVYFPEFYIPTVNKSIHPLKMLFTFRDISESFDLYVTNWFLKSNLLEPTFDLHFDTMYTSRLTIQTKFLNMVQALEAYHRRNETMEQIDWPEETHSIRVESIIGAAPPKHKDWLRIQLKYSNESYMSKRLDEILNKYIEIIDDLLPSKRKRQHFVGKVTEYRNILTHFDPKKEPPKEEDLIYIYKIIKKIVELCLLTELGFSMKDILRLIKKDNDQERSAISRFEKAKEYFKK
jgi:hypothetical protein